MPEGWRVIPNEPTRESGQSWVYRVCNTRDETTTFALKRLKNVKRRHRFQREVETMTRLADIGLPVPPVVAQDLTAEHPWFVMPWYSDGSLEDMISNEEREQDAMQRLRVADLVAAALQQLHTADVPIVISNQPMCFAQTVALFSQISVYVLRWTPISD